MLSTTYASSKTANRWRLFLAELQFGMVFFAGLFIYSWISTKYFREIAISFKLLPSIAGAYVLHTGARWLFPDNETYVSSITVNEHERCLIVRYYRSWEGEAEKRLPFVSTRIEIIRDFFGRRIQTIKLLPAKMESIKIKPGRFRLDRDSINELGVLLEAITQKAK